LFWWGFCGRVKSGASDSERPCHIGQHSGGIVIAAQPLDEIVLLEPATMPGRVVLQWDKDDCADLGIIKIDLLGLGMLAVLERPSR
jgi:error-prone DNA polymerase